MKNEPTLRYYEFDGFRLDPHKRLLLRDGQPVRLKSKAFALLLVLLERRERVLEKDELMQAVWPDTTVEENNLTVHMSALRKALGETAGAPGHIVTIPGQGYRFTAEVKETPASSELIVARRARTRVVIEEEIDEQPTVGTLAVLPFKALGAQERDEYLELGLADALITRFSHLPQLILRPTSAIVRYTGGAHDPVAAGHELSVDVVLDGRVQLVGNRLRLTVQLISVSNSAVLWAEKFEEQFTHIFAIQDSISEQVARALALRLSSEQRRRLTKHSTADTAAYQLYLKGVYYTNRGTKEGAQKGIELFQQAIEQDPHYARAYAGLADAWCWLSHLFIDPKQALPEARAAALKALELDETLAEAHLVLGLVKMWYEWEWEECERQFRRALELNPHLATAHLWYAFYLAAMGQFELALVEGELALKLDPFSLSHNAMMGWVHYFARHYDLALAQFRATIELEPHYFMAYWGLGWTLIQQGRYEVAIAELQRGLQFGGGTEVTAALSHAYAKAGRTEEARRLLAELYELTKQRYVSPFYLALAHIGLSEIEETFAALQQAYLDRFEWLVQFQVDPVWEPLHGDPRFAELLRRVGLAE